MHQKPLTRIEVHGKNLFYFFGDAKAPEIVHIHFGMSGAFKTMTLPGPETTETTRLTLENKDHAIIAHLSAMTVNLGDLGEDANPSRCCGHSCCRPSTHAISTCTILLPLCALVIYCSW